jgi:RHS repeat-associated protein
MTSKAVAIPGAGTNTFSYQYSATTGLMQSMFFPMSANNFQWSVAYDYSYGILDEITSLSVPTTIYWQATGINPRGQVTAESTGSTPSIARVDSSRVYDAVTGWLSSIQTGLASGSASALQNSSYAYDYVGNVIQRQDGNAGLTENFYYDNLYRLYYSTLTNSAGTSTNLQMCYDNTGGACTENLPGVGNITSRSDVAGGGAWTYDPTHKHQVTQAGSGSYTYSYDPNGNVATRNGTTLSWTSYNYPSSVGTASESATFDYGPNRQRWRMVYTGPSGTETTYYAAPNFEIVALPTGVTAYRQYLYVGSRPVVLLNNGTDGSSHLQSLLTDHQGSIASIQDIKSGTTDVTESFTAYGNRREASTWSGPPTSAELNTMNGITREGYTFQTVLGSMGLNHMNGRIEDAFTGRFLSADPHTYNRSNTQSWNRYSYVNNNPLSSVDPTGFGECELNAPASTQWVCTGTNLYGFLAPSSGSNFSICTSTAGECSGNPTGATNSATGSAPSGADTSFFASDLTEFASQIVAASTAADAGPNQDAAQSQTCSGCGTVWSDPNDATAGVTVTASASSSSVNFMAAQNASIVWPAILAGRAYQSAFNGTFNVLSNTTKLFTRFGNTIPDLYKSANGILELKNGAYIYNSAQINAQLAAAEAEGVPYFLGVSPTSTVAGTTSAAVEATGGEVFVFDAAAGTLSSAEGGEVSWALLEFLAIIGEQ